METVRGKGTSVRARTELCLREKGTSVRARTDLCARKTVIPWTIIIVCECGMIRVYQLKCDSLEMCDDCVPSQWLALRATCGGNGVVVTGHHIGCSYWQGDRVIYLAPLDGGARVGHEGSSQSYPGL